MEPLPEGARHTAELKEAGVAVFFAADAAAARRLLAAHRPVDDPDAGEIGFVHVTRLRAGLASRRGKVTGRA
ncbi:hypothetical protein [Nonomuraea fuscirosea]|uniref:hypothetical protein n=1 Tax=Nonomuraea fuscirosea TaxID=1291556 RepID=UPI000D0632B2|nr:hypothetical protein [Nonomuraea fuscirosea]